VIPYQELLDKIQASGRVWVRLHNDLIFCLVEATGPVQFKAKLLPCAKNSREYSIPYSQIKEYVGRD
jgi:hypothetical protein